MMQDLDPEKRKSSLEIGAIECKDPDQLIQANRRLQEQIMQALTSRILYPNNIDGKSSFQDTVRTREIKEIILKLVSRLKQCVSKQDSLGRVIKQMKENYNDGNWEKDKIEPTQDNSLVGDSSRSKAIQELQEDVGRLEQERDDWLRVKLVMQGDYKMKEETLKELQNLVKSKENQFLSAKETLQSVAQCAKKDSQDSNLRVKLLEDQLRVASSSLQERDRRVSELNTLIQTISEKLKVDSQLARLNNQELIGRCQENSKQKIDLEGAVGQLKSHNDQLLQTIDYVRKQLTIQSQQGEANTAALKQLKSQLLQLKQDRTLKDSQIQSLQLNNQQSTSQIQQLRRLLQTKQGQVSGLILQRINSQQLIYVLEKESNNSKEQYGQEREKLLETIKTLNADINLLNSDKEKINFRCTQVSLNLEEQSKTIHQLRQETQLLSNDLQKQGLQASKIKQLELCLHQKDKASQKLTLQNGQLWVQIAQLTKQNQQLTSLNSKHAGDVDSLQKQIDLQGLQIETLVDNQLELNGKLQNLEGMTLQKNVQIADKDKQVGVLMNSIALLKEQLVTIEKQRRESEQVHITTNQQATRLAKQLQSVTVVVGQQQAELAQVRLHQQSTIADYGRHQEQLKISIELLEGKVTSQAQQLELKQSRLFEMESLLQRLKQENASLIQEKTEQEEVIMLNQTRQRSTQLQEKSLVQQKQNKIGELEVEVSSLRQRLYYLQELEAKVSQQKLTIEQQMSRINSGSAIQQIMSVRSKELQESINSLSRDNVSMGVKIQTLTQQRQTYQDKATHLETNSKRLQEELQRTHTQLMLKQKLIDGLETDMQIFRQGNGLLQTETNRLIEFKETFLKQLDQTKTQSSSLRIQCEKLEGEKANWFSASQSQVKHLEEKLLATSTENTELAKKYGQLLNNIQSVRQQLGLLKMECQELKSSYSQMSTVTNQKQAQIQKLSLVNTQINNTLQSINLQNDQHKRELDKSQQIVVILKLELQASKEEANLSIGRLQQNLLKIQTLETDSQRCYQLQRNIQRLRQQNHDLQETLTLASKITESTKERLQELTLWSQSQPKQEQLIMLRQEVSTLKNQADTNRIQAELNSQLASKSSLQIETLKTTEIELKQTLEVLSVQLLQLRISVAGTLNVQKTNVGVNTNVKNMTSGIVFQEAIQPIQLGMVFSLIQPASQSKQTELAERVAHLESQLSQLRTASLATKPTYDFVLEQNTESISEQVISLQDNQLFNLKKSCTYLQKRVQDLQAQISLKECALLWVKNTLLDQNKWAYSEELTRVISQKNIGLEFKNYMRVCEQNQYLRKCLEKFTGSDAFWDQIVEQREHVEEGIQGESPVQEEDQKCIMF